jgi:hypothetical protein
MEIEIKKVYTYFDDGKIRERVTITEIIPFDKIDSDTLSIWLEEVEGGHCLYAKETDFFLRGLLDILDNEKEEIFFVRTLDNDWFSLGRWAGRLDWEYD